MIYSYKVGDLVEIVPHPVGHVSRTASCFEPNCANLTPDMLQPGMRGKITKAYNVSIYYADSHDNTIRYEIDGLPGYNYSSCMLRLVKKAKTIDYSKIPVTLGADPELVLLNPFFKQIVSAQELVSGGLESEFGKDGNPTTLELRPQPATDPIVLAENIHHILSEARTEYPEAFRLDLMASNSRIIAGGHLHFGHPLIIENHTPLVKMLNSHLLPLIALVENPANRLARLSSHYGKIGSDDVRSKSYGIEYRTPASWLSTRKLTEAVLTAGDAIANYYISGGKDLPLAITESQLRDVYNANALVDLRTLLPAIIKDYAKLPVKYPEKLNYLFRACREKRILLNIELKDGWHLPHVHSKIKTTSLRNAVIKLSNSVPIPTTNETNFVEYGNEYMVREIAKNAGVALSQLFPPLPGLLRLKVCGRNRRFGNELSIRGNLPPGSRASLRRAILSICKEFGYPAPDLYIKRVEYGGSIRISLPREMRERTDYLSEVIVCMIWLYCHRRVFAKTTLPPFRRDTLAVFFKLLGDKKRPFPTLCFRNDEGGIDIKKLLEYLETLHDWDSLERQGIRGRIPKSASETLVTVLENYNGYFAKREYVQRLTFIRILAFS